VIGMGIAHPDSLLLTGWSYGGYMTALAVTRTDRFRAASMGAGISNLISMLTTHDIPDYMAAHIGGDPWDDYAIWEKHSPIYGVGSVTTPTQVIHGQDDPRVPLTQGLEFYNALRRRGVPTEMVVYPRTGHGPDEPKFVADMQHRILAWVQPAPGPRESGGCGRIVTHVRPACRSIQAHLTLT
jgi:dipeptidyl aminopeptidase/acylaminoacyl peptidase